MTTKTPPETEPALIDVKAVAALLGCSARHVTRLEEAKLMPAAIKLGRLSRWNRVAIEQWIAAGCPDRATWENSQGEDLRGWRRGWYGSTEGRFSCARTRRRRSVMTWW